jgi:hypothetical protein
MPLNPDAERLLAMIRAAGWPPFETLTPGEALRAFAARRVAMQAAPHRLLTRSSRTCATRDPCPRAGRY